MNKKICFKVLLRTCVFVSHFFNPVLFFTSKRTCEDSVNVHTIFHTTVRNILFPFLLSWRATIFQRRHRTSGRQFVAQSRLRWIFLSVSITRIDSTLCLVHCYIYNHLTYAISAFEEVLPCGWQRVLKEKSYSLLGIFFNKKWEIKRFDFNYIGTVLFLFRLSISLSYISIKLQSHSENNFEHKQR